MEVQAYLGVDIGKSAHYAVGVDAAGKVLHQVAVRNDEGELRQLVQWAQAHAAAVVVDHPGGTAALLLRWCWEVGVPVGYLHGLAMARARDFSAGEAKTDPKDAFVLADVARAHPSRVVWLEPTTDAHAQLELLCGYDADLRADANRLSNRARALLATHWPALERVVGDRLDSPGMLAVLQRYPTGPARQRLGVARLTTLLARERVRHADRRAAELVEAARAQTLQVAGAELAGRLVAELVRQLAQVQARRQTLEQEIADRFFTLPEAALLLSLPGIGPRLGARIAVELGPISRFPTPAHLAAYAGLGPTPRQSGTSIRGNVPSRFGNHRLKNALFLAAFASLRHPPSRTSYDRKRAAGKRHHQAVLCLARRRVDVLHAMLRQGQPYRPPTPAPTSALPLAAAA